MIQFPVTSQKQQLLARRMEKLGIREEDIEEQFIRSGGSGGQKVNKTSSCVQLSHPPSGVEIKCAEARSQAANRYHARRALCDRIEEIQEGRKSARQQAAEKIRRQKRRRSRRSKQRTLDAKRKQSEKKARRRPIRNSEDV